MEETFKQQLCPVWNYNECDHSVPIDENNAIYKIKILKEKVKFPYKLDALCS